MDLKNKPILILVSVIAFAAFVIGIIAIASNITQPDADNSVTEQSNATEADTEYIPPAETPAVWSDFDVDTSWDDSATYIHCNGSAVEINGQGAKVTGDVIMIHQDGTYVLSGDYQGQIDVIAYKEEKVHLIFNGFSVSCKKKSPVLCERADKVVITLADGTQNSVIDMGSGYIEGLTPSEGRYAGAIHAKIALTINGKGALSVKTSYRHGIVSNSNLRIVSGVIEVDAIEEGLKGKESMAIRGGTISIDAVGDGLKVSDDTKEGKGFLAIEGGDLSIATDADGIDVIDYARIVGGNIKIISKDHGITTEGSVSIGGTAQISIDAYSGAEDSDAKGIKAEKDVTVEGGNVQILRAYEGIESKTASVRFNGGNTSIQSTNDGVNANVSVEVLGGSLFINATGDGIDGGDVLIDGGSTVIQGSVFNDCAPIDVPDDKKICVNGGFLLAYGSVGEMQYPSDDSSQSWLGAEVELQKGKSYTLYDASNSPICSFMALGDALTFCISSDTVIAGNTYTLFADVSPSGVHVHGVYKNAATEGGTALLTIDAK